MGRWQATTTDGIGGIHRVWATKWNGRPVEITYLRGIPIKLGDYGSADPFGDTNAQIRFPQVTVFDDPKGSDLVDWLEDYADIDIWWWPAHQVAEDSQPGLYINPQTGARDLAIDDGGTRRPKKVWEGYIANQGYSDGALDVQCQGAILQGDSHLASPQYPARPIPLDDLFYEHFDNRLHPDLRTLPLRVDYPEGWALIGPQFDTANLYTPNVEPGRKWTGYGSRDTGSWDHAVTGYLQNQLGYMITQPGCGVATGNQWTVRHERESDTSHGRQPVLMVRDRHREPDFTMWIGTPGLKDSLQHDTTQEADVLYGEGTGLDGTVWRNAVISSDGTRTRYAPLAGQPPTNRGKFTRETYVRFGAGFDQPVAVQSGSEQLQRLRDAGWSGTLTLEVDPSPTMSRYEIEAGMTMLLRGFRGSDIRLHIASKSVSPSEGTVTLQVDDRYRDLLTVAQALQRARDSLTPSMALQINKASQIIEDVQAPWDYTAGSGFVPRTSVPAYKAMPATDTFPHAQWMLDHPPSRFPSWYVPCQANSTSKAARWAGPVPILMSEKGTIRRAEFAMVDRRGVPVKVRFHLSLYYVNVTSAAMPRDGAGPSPWITGAFETINPATGQEWPAGNFLRPDESYIVGWGNYREPAGYSPGRYTDGAAPSGLLVDESTWTFDCTNNPNYNKLARPGQTQIESAITVYAMFYCEYTEPVYFTGRLFRQPQGS